mmetsp:Transcript_309/g.466  ORF Transcript_309/g.466 Transcript_309/m.466 type:complete len:114 (+) Transcript_309:16-357(+)
MVWMLRLLSRRPSLLSFRHFCTPSNTTRESELFWSSKVKHNTDESVPRKRSEIPNHAEEFEEMNESELAEVFASAESKLHNKPKGKSDKDVWSALSKARKYQLEKDLAAKKKK